MDSMPLPPPPPPPLPGSEGSIPVPTYKEQRQQEQRQPKGRTSASPAFDQNNNCTNSDNVMDPLREQQYANMPSALSSCLSKDKKPFTYTIGGVGEKGILDLNQIKSPRMKKRLQANLRGDEDPKNEIRPQSSLASDPVDLLTSTFDPSPIPPPSCSSSAASSIANPCPTDLDPMVQDLVHGASSPPAPAPASSMRPSNMMYAIPPPPATTIQSLENLAIGLPTSGVSGSMPRPGSGNATAVPFNPRYNSHESAVEDQLSSLSSGLKLDTNNNNNNNSPYTYTFNNHNNSPKPFSPGSAGAPFASSPFDRQQKQPSPAPLHQQQQSPPQAMNRAPTLAQQVSGGTPLGFSMKSIEEYENSFPRPPPPTVSLVPGREKAAELPRSKSPVVVANPQSAIYAPNVQEQWMAKKQQQQYGASPYGAPQQQQSAPQRPMAPPAQQQQQFNRSNSYDRKMHEIREANADILPPNPQIAYAPTLQEQWMMKKQSPSAGAPYQAPAPAPVAAAAAPAPMRANPTSGIAPVDHRKSFVVLDAPNGAEYRAEPMQSKSFRLLQKLTEGIEDELEEFKALQEMNRLDNEKRQQMQRQQQAHQAHQPQAGAGQYYQSGSMPANVVPNPPQAYAPTLQEQWLAKKGQQSQSSQQSHSAPARPAAPLYQPMASQPQQIPVMRQQQQQNTSSLPVNMDPGREYVIPIQVQERTREQTSRQEQQRHVTTTATGDFSTIPRLPQPPMPSNLSCSFPSSGLTMDPFYSPFPATTTGFY